MNKLSRQIDLTGGESVYCINTFQMERAVDLYHGSSPESDQLRETVLRVETDLSRNQQAALAMILLKRLKSAVPQITSTENL